MLVLLLLVLELLLCKKLYTNKDGPSALAIFQGFFAYIRGGQKRAKDYLQSGVQAD